MKRCIICGNLGDDNSTTCEVCGNPYLDTGENLADFDETVDETVKEMPEEQLSEEVQDGAGAGGSGKSHDKTGAAALEGETETDVRGTAAEAGSVSSAGAAEKTGTGAAAVPAGEAGADVSEGKTPAGTPGTASGRRPGTPEGQPRNGRPVRRSTGAPRIYGQTPPSNTAAPQQGMVSGRIQGGQRIPAGGGQPQGRPAGRPVNSQGTPAGRTGNGQRTPAGRPGTGQGVPAGRPGSGQGVSTGRPGAGQGGPTGRPVPVQGRPGGPTGRPGPMQGAPTQRQGMQPRGMAPGGFRAGRIMETARDTLRSPLFILIALLHTIYLAGSVAAIFLKELNFSQFVRVVSDVSLPSQLTGYMDSLVKLMARLDTDAVVVNLIIRIPDLLFCIGLWMVVIAVRSKKEKMPTGGFVFMKTVVIIEMIKVCIVMLAGLVIAVALVVSAWASGTGSMIAAAVITLVLMVIITLMAVMYYFCYLATIKACRLNASSGESYGRASVYVAVVHIILALLCTVNLLSGIVNVEISGIVGSAAKMGWMILFGVWILIYRSDMKEIDE